MKRTLHPELPAPKFKKKARVVKAQNLVRTTIDVELDDPTAATREGNVTEFIAQAMRRFRLADDAEVYNRTEGLQDCLMVDGEGQWDDDIRGARQREKRPCLTLNRFIPMIAHVVNEERMAKIGTTVEPVGGGADIDDALIRQGLIRHIEVDSHVETVDDECFERMVEKGWSWQRVVTDWESEVSHNQRVLIEMIDNDFSVYSDPSAIEPTRKDAKWHFIVWDMPRGQYLLEHKGSTVAGLTNWSSIGDTAPGWITPDSIRIAEYYYMEEIPAKSVRLVGGDGVWEDEIEERDGLWYKKEELDAMDRGALQPEKVLPVPVETDDESGKPITRDSYKLKPKWCKINAVEILDGDKGKKVAENTKGRDIAGKYLPMIMFAGRQRTVKGVRRLSGMVRNNRDAQRMYNYAVSAFVEMIALAPKSPFIIAAGQVEAFKPIWDTMNIKNWPYLPYTPVAINGQPVPPPTRLNIEQPVAALGAAIREFDNDLKIGFNIYDPSLGTAKSDQSGRAIAGLQARSDSANFNWHDNANRARVFRGEVILEMIPTIYDKARTINIVRPDDKQEEIRINQTFKDKDGAEQNHDMAVGKFSVTIATGQFASKRQQSVQNLSDIAKNVPQVALALLPLIISNMDGPGMKEALEVVKKMQPPQLQDQGSPEQMAAQFQQMMQQHQLLVTALQRANETLKTKQLDLASREYIAGLQAQAQIVAAALKTGSAQSIAMATNEYKRITDLLNQNHERILAEQQQAHELTLQANEPEPAASQST